MDELPDRIDYIKSQASWPGGPLDVSYGLGMARLTKDHAPSGDNSMSGGLSAQQIIDALGTLRKLGVTISSVPIPPVRDVEAYLDHTQWVIEEIRPRL